MSDVPVVPCMRCGHVSFDVVVAEGGFRVCDPKHRGACTRRKREVERYVGPTSQTIVCDTPEGDVVMHIDALGQPKPAPRASVKMNRERFDALGAALTALHAGVNRGRDEFAFAIPHIAAMLVEAER